MKRLIVNELISSCNHCFYKKRGYPSRYICDHPNLKGLSRNIITDKNIYAFPEECPLKDEDS